MIGYFLPLIFVFAKILLLSLVILLLFDLWLLFGSKGSIEAKRILNDRFSNGDDNKVQIKIKSLYTFPLKIIVVDEIPYQFQIRNFKVVTKAEPGQTISLSYFLKPTTRGIYDFGKINILLTTQVGLCIKRKYSGEDIQVKVYPSYIKLHQYELMAISQNLTMKGQKKVRKVGVSNEFDTIRDYVMGDDPRHLNWKATARRGHLMTNHFVDERSQNVYCIIDKSRVMKMPFNGMTLLDYSINASLVMSDISLKKGDRAGLVTFEDKIDSFIKASNRNVQIHQIMESLYAQKTSFNEPDFGALFSIIQQNITQRSLILLFTNFESIHSLNRQLRYLELINRKHLLLVIYFRNTEVDVITKEDATTTREIYDQAIAYSLLDEKLRIKDALSRAGILSLYTQPENLNVDVINKYIEVKGKQML